MRARHARRAAPWLSPVKAYVYDGTDELVKIVQQPTISVRELLRAAVLILAFLPVSLLLAGGVLAVVMTVCPSLPLIGGGQ